MLQIVVQDVVIRPVGYDLPWQADREAGSIERRGGKAGPGGYNGEFVVLYYQPDTHEKTIVNTEIPVNITVEP